MSWEKGGAKPTSLTTREIKKVEGGKFDNYGFYILPEGGKSLRNLLPLIWYSLIS